MNRPKLKPTAKGKPHAETVGLRVSPPRNPTRDEAILILAKMGLRLAEQLAEQPSVNIESCTVTNCDTGIKLEGVE